MSEVDPWEKWFCQATVCVSYSLGILAGTFISCSRDRAWEEMWLPLFCSVVIVAWAAYKFWRLP